MWLGICKVVVHKQRGRSLFLNMGMGNPKISLQENLRARRCHLSAVSGAVPAIPGGSLMQSKRVVLLVVALCCLLGMTPSALFSQTASSGTVAGTVADPSGAAIVDATVTLTDPSTNDARKTTTNDAGRYIFA